MARNTVMEAALRGLKAYEQNPSRATLRRLLQSIEALESILSSLREGDFPRERANAQTELSYCYALLPTGDKPANLKRALRGYEEALDLYREETSPRQWASIQLRLGTVWSDFCDLGEEGALAKAIGCFKAALRVYTKSRFPKHWAMAWNNMGTAYYCGRASDYAGNLKRAIKCYRMALKVRTERRFPADWATSMNNLGVAYHSLMTGDRTKHLTLAIKYYKATLRVRTEKKRPWDWGATQNNLASAYSDLPSGDRPANLRRAIGCYEAALRVHTKAEFPADWATAKNNLGTVYETLPTGDLTYNLTVAISCYDDALLVYTARDHPVDYAMVQHNLGRAVAALPSGDPTQNLKRAIGHYEESLRYRPRKTYPAAWANTQHSLGNAYLALPGDDRTQNLYRAIKHYEAALEERTEEARAAQWASTRHQLGKAHAALEDGDKVANLTRAMTHYDAALRVLNESDYPFDWADLQDALGLTHYEMPVDRAEHLAAAVGHWGAALRVYDADRFPGAMSGVLDSLSAAHFELGNWRETLEAAERSMGVLEKLRTASIEDIQGRRTIEGAWGPLTRGILAAVRLHDFQAALNLSARAKARSLSDQILHHDLLVHGGSKELSVRYEALSARRRELWKMYRDAAGRAHIEGESRRVTDLGDELGRVNAEWLELVAGAGEAVRSGRIVSPQTVSDWGRIAERCRAVLVEMRVTEEGTYLFLVGPGQTQLLEHHVVVLPGLTVPVVVETEQEWISFCYSETRTVDWASWMDSVCVDMHAGLMGPLAARLAKYFPDFERLILLPNLRLGLFPLHAACAADAQGEGSYFLDRYEITYAPSVDILAHCLAREERQGARGRSLMAVIDSSLPNGEWELRSIEQFFPGKRTILSASQSKESIMASIRDGECKLFATHGRFNWRSVEDSALEFNRERGEHLSVRELMSLDLSGSWLAVLSACETGVTDAADLTDDHPGLASAFLVAGVHTVIASLWMVEDSSTALLISRFHENIYVRGMSKAAALRAAQCWLRSLTVAEVRQLLQSGADGPAPPEAMTVRGLRLVPRHGRDADRPFSSPYFWAGFFAFGAPGSDEQAARAVIA